MSNSTSLPLENFNQESLEIVGLDCCLQKCIAISFILLQLVEITTLRNFNTPRSGTPHIYANQSPENSPTMWFLVSISATSYMRCRLIDALLVSLVASRYGVARDSTTHAQVSCTIHSGKQVRLFLEKQNDLHRY